MPHMLHTKSLAAHVADLHAALQDTASKWPRAALALLQGDALAQIMSFVPSRRQQCGLTAVSPQMRLDSEVMADEGRNWRVEPRAPIGAFFLNSTWAVQNNELLVRFDADIEESNRQQMLTSLWWASRCGLPVELFIYNHDREMLAHLGGALRSRVKRLTVTTRSSPASAADDAVVSNSTSDITALASLLSFPNVQSLSIRNDEQQADAPVPAEVLNDCEAAASSLAAAGSRVCGTLQDLRTLADSRFLRSLTVINSGLRSLDGLSNCSMLEKLIISECPYLTNITTVSSLPRLQEVEISECNLQSLDGLDRCTALRSVNVSGNRSLQSLSPLAGAPLLETIVAIFCDIRSVQGLGSCAVLTLISLYDNPHLKCLHNRSKAPCLRHLSAGRCGLRDLGEVGPWSALREIDVNGNRDLQSLSGLAEAPLLEEVHAMGCDVQDFTVLDTCPKLRKVFKTEYDYSDGE